MPEYEITAPDGRTFVVTAPEGASESEIIAYAQKNMPKPTTGEAFTRGVGLGVRDAVMGVGQLPGMLYDAAAVPLNLGIKGINAVAGTSIPEIRSAQENLGAVANAAGLPSPSTPGERIRSDIGRNVAGLIPSMATGAALQAGGPVAQKVGQALMTAPVSQVTGAVGTGIGEGAARENGYGPAVQFGAALAGGITGAAVPSVVSALGQGVVAATQPFRQGGREKIVAEALLRNSSDPETLAQRLRDGADDTTRRLPGAPVTAGVAARDPQMMLLESGLRSDAQTVPGAMSPATAMRDVDARRNAARLATAEGLLRDEGDVAARGATVRGALTGAEEGMKAETNRLYKAAETTERFPVKPILDKLDEVEAKYFGELSGGMPGELREVARDLRALMQPKPGSVPAPRPSSIMLGSMVSPSAAPAPVAGDVSWTALQNLYSRVGKIVGNAQAGTDKDNRVVAAGGQLQRLIDELGSTPEWQAAKAQRRAQGSALGRDESGVNAVGRALMTDRWDAPMMPDARVAPTVTADPGAVRQTLGALDKGIADAKAAGLPPERIAAIQAQADTARGAMRNQFIDDMLTASKTTSDIADASGNVTRQLSPAQFRWWWEKNADTANLLFPDADRRTLERLAADFAEGTVLNTARARGSDTAQNLSVGNFIARLTGGVVDPQNPLAQAVGNMGPIAGWIMKAPEQAMRQMIVEAMRDPKFAAMLVEKAGPGSLQRALTYMEGTMGQRVQEAGMDALAREIPRVLLAVPSNPQEPRPRGVAR